nr:PREDICTED: uncharacterized protein LOC105669565 [Linepithema humile]
MAFPTSAVRGRTVSILVKGELISVKNTMRYLGVTLDGDWTFAPHFENAIPKAERMFTALSGIMPNLKGPREQIRRLYANVIHSVLLYAAPVWASDVTGNNGIKREISKLQRKISLRLCCGYRTISFVAAMILARQIPLDLTALALRRVYIQSKNLEQEGAPLEHAAKVRLCIQAKREALTEWENRVRNIYHTSGLRTTQAILPCFKKWYERAGGYITFHSTQMVSGHGCFQDYLHKRKRAASSLCEHCGGGPDTAQHTLEFCSAWEQERRELRGVLDRRTGLSLPTIIETIVGDKEKWRAFTAFCGRVMRAKEEAEREREREGLGINLNIP